MKRNACEKPAFSIDQRADKPEDECVGDPKRRAVQKSEDEALQHHGKPVGQHARKPVLHDPAKDRFFRQRRGDDDLYDYCADDPVGRASQLSSMPSSFFRPVWSVNSKQSGVTVM